MLKKFPILFTTTKRIPTQPAMMSVKSRMQLENVDAETTYSLVKASYTYLNSYIILIIELHLYSSLEKC